MTDGTRAPGWTIGTRARGFDARVGFGVEGRGATYP